MKPGDQSGSPMSQESSKGGMQPTKGSSGSGEQKNEGKSPGHGKKSGSTPGEQGGDRSGNGGEGGGDQGMKPGMGQSGGSTPSEDGSGMADGPGKGESGKQGGDGQVANQPTGRAGNQPGKGSSTQKGGEKAGPGEASKQSRNGEKKPGAKGESEEGDSNPSGPGQERAGGGRPPNELKMHEGDPMNRRTGSGVEAETNEEANAEYARKVTQLTLEKLRQQADKPDPELLKRLGADPNDKEFLRRFLDRWEKMYSDAAQPGETGKQGARELDDALKSLGLRPQSNKVRGTDNADDNLRDKDVSASRPPEEYERLFRAYNRATRELKKAP